MNKKNDKILNNTKGKTYFSPAVSDLYITSPSDEEQIVQMWGHTLNITDNSISCDDCELRKEIPNIVKGSDGFTLVVFKLYFLHAFKEESCNEDQGMLLETDAHPYDLNPPSVNDYTYIPGDVYWS